MAPPVVTAPLTWPKMPSIAAKMAQPVTKDSRPVQTSQRALLLVAAIPRRNFSRCRMTCWTWLCRSRSASLTIAAAAGAATAATAAAAATGLALASPTLSNRAFTPAKATMSPGFSSQAPATGCPLTNVPE